MAAGREMGVVLWPCARELGFASRETVASFLGLNATFMINCALWLVSSLLGPPPAQNARWAGLAGSMANWLNCVSYRLSFFDFFFGLLTV